MSKIFVIIGKSSTGKDTIYQRIIKDSSLPLKTVVSYTTRPIRAEEKDGREYHFRSVPEFEKMLNDGKIIEYRVYHTVLGDWYYFTADDGQINLETSDYLLIMTLEGYEHVLNYYGKDNVVPIYIEVDGYDRLSRSLLREKNQKEPHYDEVCRRFLADEADFSEEYIHKLDIDRRFFNNDLDTCVSEVTDFIKRHIWILR